MIIEKDNDNWSITTEDYIGKYHLVYDTTGLIITFLKSDGITSTQENLFVGTEAECEQHIVETNLFYPALGIEQTIPLIFADEIVENI